MLRNTIHLLAISSIIALALAAPAQALDPNREISIVLPAVDLEPIGASKS